MTDAPMTVANMPRVSVPQDGTIVELVFVDAQGKSVTLRFSPERLNQFLPRIVRSIADAQNQRHATPGHLEVQAVRVATASAQSPVGGGRVILGLRDQDGVLHPFSIPLSAIDQLQSEIGVAAKRAKEEGGQTRQ